MKLTIRQKKLFISRLVQIALILLIIAEAYTALRLFGFNWSLAMNENLRGIEAVETTYIEKYESIQLAKSTFKAGNAIAALTMPLRLGLYLSTCVALVCLQRRCTRLTAEIRDELCKKRRANRIHTTTMAKAKAKAERSA